MQVIGFYPFKNWFWCSFQNGDAERGSLFALFIALSIFALPSLLSAGPETECYIATNSASQATGVPQNLLHAIAKAETGRGVHGDVQPWPWAINVRGKGEWLPSKAALLERALEQVTKGETQFDVGCFQLNYRWHGDAFDSLDQMIDPPSNALYAAQFLKSLYAEFSDWNTAVGAYHSRNEARGRAYQTRIASHYDDSSIPRFEAVTTRNNQNNARKNNFPLLRISTGQTGLGSLVPTTNR